MKAKNRLTKPDQYSAVYNQGNSFTDSLLVLRARVNYLEYSRYGISVSKRVGKAVVRNRVKRILREIIKSKSLNPGEDIIFIARRPAAESNYHILDKSVTNLLFRAQISKRANENSSPGND